MKRLAIGTSIVILLFVAVVYAFIPQKLTISNIVVVNSPVDAVNRFLESSGNWNKWWPANSSESTSNSPLENNSFKYKESKYKLTRVHYNAFELSIQQKDIIASSAIYLIPKNDSVLIQWKCDLPATSNIFSKIYRYRLAVSIKKEMAELLKHLQLHLNKQENLYGFLIKRSSTSDTLLIATKTITNSYPSVQKIYSLVNDLKVYLHEAGAKQANSPMINVSKVSEDQFQLMVAIPINKKLNNKGNIYFTRMVPALFLVTEVKGGNATVDKALHMLDLYTNDRKKSLMALPFQYLITDRSKVTDTSNWITRIYYPISY